VPILLALWLIHHVVVEKLWRRRDCSNRSPLARRLLSCDPATRGLRRDEPTTFSERTQTVSVFKVAVSPPPKTRFLKI